MTEAVTTPGDTVPTSPIAAVFSDNAMPHSTPPSSPPGFPWEQRDGVAIGDDKRVAAAAKSAFSVLGKRNALDAISDNARPAKKVATATKTNAKHLTQLQISLGQEVQTKCKTCGMEYVSSSAEDQKLHKKYHQQNTEGYDVGKDFVSKARPDSVFAGTRKEDKICALDGFDAWPRKKRGQAALEVVQRELGAVEIPKEDIWSLKRCELLSLQAFFKAYLYIRGTKCIGFLLVQKIDAAHRVVEPVSSARRNSNEHDEGKASTKSALAVLKERQQEAEQLLQQPIELSTETFPALLGVSRIWTSPTHRKQNIATTLLDVAFKDSNKRADRSNPIKFGLSTAFEAKETRETINSLMLTAQKLEGKQGVAFSQPTDSGVRLARRWFGNAYGWGVYVD